MQLISYAFVILWMSAFALYYLVPKKAQWYVLLGASILFYCIGLRGFPIGLLLTGAATYGFGAPILAFWTGWSCLLACRSIP